VECTKQQMPIVLKEGKLNEEGMQRETKKIKIKTMKSLKTKNEIKNNRFLKITHSMGKDPNSCLTTPCKQIFPRIFKYLSIGTSASLLSGNFIAPVVRPSVRLYA
jgi:hypothetical protein